MTLPNFLIIGAQKAGTSWLARNLSDHPHVFVAPHEIHFFDKEHNYSQGLAWYERHFDAVCDETAVGEKTPDYLWANGQGVEGHLPEVHLNLHRTLPNAKLIVMLRNPVERAISAVNHIIRSGRVSPIHSLDELLLGDKQHLVEGHGVLEYGRYQRQIAAYQELSDPEQLLILIFEEDVVQSSAGLKKACEFLQVDPAFEFRNKGEKRNVGVSRMEAMIRYYVPFVPKPVLQLTRRLPVSKSRPSPSTEQELYRLFEEDNEELFEALGHRVSAWEIQS